MDKEELVDVTVSPSSDTSTTTTDTNTQAPTVNESDATKEVNVEKTESTVTTEEQKPQEEQKDQKELSEREFNALRVKQSKLEKERNEYAKQAEEIRKARYNDYLDLLNDPATNAKANEKFARSPQEYEEFRQTHKRLTGEDIGEYSTRFGQPANQQTNTNVNRPSVDPETLKQQVKQELREEQEMAQVAQEFWKAVPDMDPRNAKTEEDREILSFKAQGLDRVVAGLKEMYPDVPKTQLYIEAWNMLPENRYKQVENSQLKGELIGKAKAFNSAAGNTTIGGGGSATQINTQTYKLTKAQEELYNRMKLADPAQAEKYAKRAHQMNLEG